MPWPEGTTLAQIAAQAPTGRQPLRGQGPGSIESERAAWGQEKDLARAELELINRRRGRAQKATGRAPPPSHAAAPPVQEAEPLGGYGQHAHHGPHAHVEPSGFTGLIAANNARPRSTPPDQGLCVGNGFVMETVNSMLRVYRVDGAALTPPITLNSFLGLAPWNSTTGVRGPVTSDPSCWYDTQSRRFFFVVLTLDTNPATGRYTGVNWLDVAVSVSSDPTGAWQYYRLPATNDGSDGTPNLGCDGGYCLGDYPMIVVWDHALIITVNEFSFVSDTFLGAMVYALDKQALVQGLASVNTVLINPGADNGAIQLDTLIPARQFGACELRNEWLMATSPARLSGSVDMLRLLRLRGTASLATASPAHVTLEWVEADVKLDFSYTVPPPATQKPGFNPLGIYQYGTSQVALLDSSDGRMVSVSLVGDRLYAAWGTGVQGAAGQVVAGAAWAVVDPRRSARALDGGVISMPGGNHLLMPALAVRPGGVGVMALTVTGPDYFPSPAYALLTPGRGLGPVTLLAHGAGPLDNWDGYEFPTARFGDYAMALVTDRGVFWVASEWIAQSCTLAEFEADFTCGGTRSYLTNWATRVSRIEVDEYGY